jgi:hypothetical protein
VWRVGVSLAFLKKIYMNKKVKISLSSSTW